MSITVDYATLHQAAGDVRSTRTEVDGELKKLQGAVDMLAGAWQGAGGASFQTLMARWREDTNKLLTAMNNIADMLDESGTAAQVTDEEQQQMMNQFTSALNP